MVCFICSSCGNPSEHHEERCSLCHVQGSLRYAGPVSLLFVLTEALPGIDPCTWERICQRYGLPGMSPRVFVRSLATSMHMDLDLLAKTRPSLYLGKDLERSVGMPPEETP